MCLKKEYKPTVERKYLNTIYFPYSMGYRNNIVRELKQKIKKERGN